MLSNQIQTPPNEVPLLPGVPLLGSIPDVLRNSEQFFRKALNTGHPMVRIHLGPVTGYIVNDPQYFRMALQDKWRNYIKGGGVWDTLRQMLGNGVTVSEGEYWLRQRRLLQPAFHRKHYASIADLALYDIELTAQRWQAAAASGETMELLQEMHEMMLRVTVRTMFSQGMSSEEAVEFGHRFVGAVKYLEPRSYLFFVPKSFPFPGKADFEGTMALMDRIIYRIIGERRAHGSDAQDLLALLLDATDEDTGEKMTDVQLRDEVIGIFLAGHESSSTVLMWLFTLLNDHPEVEARMIEELNRVLGGRAPTMADFANLPYTRMVVDEALRMYPIVWMVTRTAVEADTLGEYAIPKGALLFFSYYHTMRHPKYWNNPEKFDPERFANGSPGAHYLPFGTGPHLCMGQHLAVMEILLVAATLVPRFRVRVQPLEGALVPRPRVSLRPNQSVPFKVELR
jgi:cytochrome P450